MGSNPPFSVGLVSTELSDPSEHCSSHLQNGDNKSSPNRVAVRINIIQCNLPRTVPEHSRLKA